MHSEYIDGGDYPEVFYPVQAGAGACADRERDARKNADAPNEDDPALAVRYEVLWTRISAHLDAGNYDAAAGLEAEFWTMENAKS